MCCLRRQLPSNTCHQISEPTIQQPEADHAAKRQKQSELMAFHRRISVSATLRSYEESLDGNFDCLGLSPLRLGQVDE